MGKYARHKCIECQIIRPAYNMKQVEKSKKSGHIGWGFSFNPQRQKSIRIQSPRNLYRKQSVWICKSRLACNDPNYFKKLEIEEQTLKSKNSLIKLMCNEIHHSITKKLKVWKKIYSDNNLYNYNIWNNEKRLILIALDNEVRFGNLQVLKNEFDIFCKKNEKIINEVLVIQSFFDIWSFMHAEIKKFLKNSYTKNLYNIIKLDSNKHEQYCPLIVFDFGHFKNTEKKIFDNKNKNIKRSFFSKPSEFLNNFDKLLLIFETHINNWFFRQVKLNIIKNNRIKNDQYFDEIFIKIFGESLQDFNNIEKNVFKKNNFSINKKNKLNINQKKILKELYYHPNFFDLITGIYSVKILSIKNSITKEERNIFSEITKIEDNSKKMDLVLRIIKVPNFESIIAKLFNKKYSNKNSKLQLINNLYFLAEADKDISQKEQEEIKNIAFLIGLNDQEINNIYNNLLNKNDKKSNNHIDEFDEIIDDIDFYD